MGVLRAILVLGLVQYAFTDSFIMKKCPDGNAECVKESVQGFFKDTSSGVQELKPTDPITIPSVLVNEDDLGFKSEFKNVKVTGFKEVILSDLKTDSKELYTSFVMKFNLVSEGDVTVTHKSGKTFSGTFKYEGGVEGDTKYTYTTKNENNKEYYEISPETLKCDADNVKAFINTELREALIKDHESKSIYEKLTKEHYEKVECAIATVVFRTAMENLRTYGRQGF